MMDRSFGIGFLGISHAHTNARLAHIARSDRLENLGFYDADPVLARRFRERHGLRRFGTPEELLAQPGLRLAVVEAFERDAADFAMLAAANRTPFLLEKPGASTAAKMRAVVEAAKRHGVLGHVGYMLRYSPALAAARKILDDGRLGPLTLARFHASTPAGLAGEIWQSRPENPGGLLYTIGCHMLDLIILLLGRPRDVRAFGLKLPPGPPVTIHGFKEDVLAGAGQTLERRIGDQPYEDVFASVLHFDSVLATFDLTGWEAHRWIESWTLDFYGTEGTLHVSILPPRLRLFLRASGWQDGTFPEQSLGDAIGQVFADELDDVVRRVERNEVTATADLQHALATIDVMERLYAAVDVPGAPQ